MSEQYPGKYIVIEGIDGAGTTTQRNELINALKQQSIDATAVAEPGGTPIGEALRGVIKNASLERMTESNLAMFSIARAELMHQVMRPALLVGTYVVSDRNWLSSYAYQGIGEGLDTEIVEGKSREAMGDLFVPDFRILLDVPVEISMERVIARSGKNADYFEKKGPAFFERVRAGYLQAAKTYDFTILDGTESINTIHRRIAKILGITALTFDT